PVPRAIVPDGDRLDDVESSVSVDGETRIEVPDANGTPLRARHWGERAEDQPDYRERATNLGARLNCVGQTREVEILRLDRRHHHRTTLLGPADPNRLADLLEIGEQKKGRLIEPEVLDRLRDLP